MKRLLCVSIIVENIEGEVLLLLRDNKSTMVFPNQWTLISANVGDGETPERAAHREFAKQNGLDAVLTFWKRYDRQHPFFIVDQHIYTAKAAGILGEGQAHQFFKPYEIEYLKIGYGFKALLQEYFLTTIGSLHVHYS